MEVFFGNTKVDDTITTNQSRKNLTVTFGKNLPDFQTLLMININTQEVLYMVINISSSSEGKQIGDYIPPTQPGCYFVYLYQQKEEITSVSLNKLMHQPLLYSQKFCVQNQVLTEKQEKYCRCVLDVAAKDLNNTYNPYAVCAKSVGTTYRTCTEDYYNFEDMPYLKLRAYARLHHLPIKDTQEQQLVVINKYLKSKEK